MAVVKDTLEVCGSILQILSKIENFEEDWFILSADYQSQAEILRSKLKFYGEQVRIYGQPADSTMMKTLTKAQSTLLKTESRLSKLEEKVDSDPCCFPGWWLYAKFSMTLFPGKLERVFNQLIKELDNIPETLRDEAEIVALMQQADRRRANPTTIHNNDGLYVAIEKSQSAVLKAIEDLDGPSIILLHGGVGKGKSTLARYVNERYGDSGDVEKRNLFEHVILVPCSNTGPDPSTKQFEILEHLSPDCLCISLEEKEKSNSKSRIAKALRFFLNGRKILVILDDVSDARFLYEMWRATEGSKNTKYLVTSQSSNLCGSFKNESLLIAMEDPTKDEARMILASLSDWQVIAEKMIETTEGNPLALACLASNFTYSRDNQDKRAWQDAYKELRNLLDNPEDKIVLGHSEYAPRSLWAAMKMCLDSLETRGAKVILFLLYACKGESIPEEVLRILYSRSKTSSSSFMKSREELFMRELVKPSRRNLAHKTILKEMDRKDEMQMMSTIWSIRSLVKLYMEHQMANKEEIRSVIGALVADNHDFTLESGLEHGVADHKVAQDKTRVAITLCALFFDRGHIDPIVTHAITEASKKSNLNDRDDSTNDLRRTAIEPIIWLLDQPEEEGWSQTDICCARKVFLKYICEHELDDHNITRLLKLVYFPFAQLASLMAISRICQLEELPMLKENKLNFIHVVLHILSANNMNNNIRNEASRALRFICFKANRDQSTFLVATLPGALEILASSMHFPIGELDFLVENVTHAFANLAYFNHKIGDSVKREIGASVKEKILNGKGVLKRLVKLVCMHEKPHLQEAATRALGNLASTCSKTSFKLKIANEGEALAGLVRLLSQHGSPNVQAQATRALANLAGTTENSLKMRIANEDGAITSLVRLLYEHENPSLQEEATAALRNLAGTTNYTLQLRIANEVGALAGLVKLLYEHGKPNLQEQAAAALKSLAHTTENYLKFRIANEDRALIGLVNLLHEDGKPSAQEQAVVTLRNLTATTNNSLKGKIANEDGALVGIVKLLYEHGMPKVQERAAGVLRNLAGTTDNALKFKIVNEDGALAGLVGLLYEHGKPGLQEQAAMTLKNLACTTEHSLKFRIASEGGALDGLVQLLCEHDKPKLQELGSKTLETLVDMDGGSSSNIEEMKEILKGTEGLLKALVKLLANGILKKVQYAPARALTKIDLATSKETSLHSNWAHRGRAGAYIDMEMYGEALHDCDQAIDLHEPTSVHTLCTRCFVKAKLGDFEGALHDANEAVRIEDDDTAHALQERGILKCMMGNLDGALADLNEGLKMNRNDYEMQKHRGYVKSLLKDENRR